ncbi:hypothetical protein JCGZ_02251 [Jatropha curcas]|uniref:Uncharacterized protein n=1 Tax=Jatropha curcas TaxID=180498 RepID=A0A067KZ92_JATCU|nr:hypothetical protein JCGZ_02251 [Jatropha curcas]
MSISVATSINQVAKTVLIWSSRQKYSLEFPAVTMKEMVKSQTNETTQPDVSDPPPVSPGQNPGPDFPRPPIPSPPAPDIPMPKPGMPPPPIQPPPDNLPPLPRPDIERPELPEIVPPPSIIRK